MCFLPTLRGCTQKTSYDKLTIIFKLGLLYCHNFPLLILNSAAIGHIYVNNVFKEFVRWFVNIPPAFGSDKTFNDKLTIIFKVEVFYHHIFPLLILKTLLKLCKFTQIMCLGSSWDVFSSNIARLHSKNLLR